MEGFSSREQTSFWQFSDQLRLHTSNFSNLSIGDSIWSDSYTRRTSNFDNPSAPAAASLPSDLGVNGWKMGFGSGSNQKLAFGTSFTNRYNNNNNHNHSNDSKNSSSDGIAVKNGKYLYSNNNSYSINNQNSNNYSNEEINNYFNKAVGKQLNSSAGSGSKKKNNYNDSTGKKKNATNANISNNNINNSAVDKRFKTLPPSEALPRNEAIGGYIFVCNNDTMQENLKRQLFGLPPRYRDSVRAITPGLPLFLYNYSTHQLHGIFEAASFGGTNIDPSAWEDKKCRGESRFPAQVRVMTRKICDPLEEDAFRPILHHYDGPKFRLELNVEEALNLLDIFAENTA